jgi:hypothetical protein
MLDRLSQADRICGAGALLALVASFLPWYHFDSGSMRVTSNAFGTGFLGDVVFFAAAATVLLLLIRHRMIPVRNAAFADDPRTLMIAGLTALGAVVLQMLIGINGSGAFHHMTLGIVIALFATGAMAIGGRMQSTGLGSRHSRGLR